MRGRLGDKRKGTSIRPCTMCCCPSLWMILQGLYWHEVMDQSVEGVGTSTQGPSACMGPT